MHVNAGVNTHYITVECYWIGTTTPGGGQAHTWQISQVKTEAQHILLTQLISRPCTSLRLSLGVW